MSTARVLGIVGFVLSFIGFLDVAGLVLSIVALVKSRRARERNGFAVAGIAVASFTILMTALFLAVLIPPITQLVDECNRLGTGTHVVGNTTYTCTPTGDRAFTNG
ncbi:DUF4190 domain-containing protein [Leifsonia sp. NPDC056824]|uniref:DUF4190 domain-containing protein n=1 Tax=Leifsonia sp. NPDC056824 TaxID=3345953 RepID=UPI0036A7BFA5